MEGNKEEKLYKATIILFSILILFGGLILFLLHTLVDAKADCDAYYSERVKEFIKDNNICLGSVEDRLENIDLERFFNTSEWRIEK
jgi:hypothetical protein